jgi:BirA family biotin operon repressor/biotin-[acetyl-CoA-carboxylase] ligase
MIKLFSLLSNLKLKLIWIYISFKMSNPDKLEFLSHKEILSQISPKYRYYLEQIKLYKKLPSTNSYLLEQAKNKNSHRAEACLAEQQTAGRGRLGRNWYSPFGQNIYLSLLWWFGSSPNYLNGLNLVIALATLTALKKYGVKNRIGLKWPNDLLWRKRKLAGILIELLPNRSKPSSCWAVIGIGLNLNLEQKNGENPVKNSCDLITITKQIPKRNRVAAILIEQLIIALNSYEKHGLDPFIKKWRKVDLTYKKKITLITPQQTITGTSLGISKNGSLILQDQSGKKLLFSAGEISLRF